VIAAMVLWAIGFGVSAAVRQARAGNSGLTDGAAANARDTRLATANLGTS
jgi:hypothetical protein